MLTLDDAGKLVLSYMGTDPPMQSVDVRHSAEVDFAALDSEYRELAGHIQALGPPSEAVVPQEQLLITAQVCAICLQAHDMTTHTLPSTDMLTPRPTAQQALARAWALVCSGPLMLRYQTVGVLSDASPAVHDTFAFSVVLAITAMHRVYFYCTGSLIAGQE